MNDKLEALLSKQDIHELSCRYMRGLDRHDGELMLDQFWQDGWCEYGFYNSPPKEFINFCMTALKDHIANQHLIGNVLIDIEGDEAFGEVYFQAYHKLAGESGLEDLIIAGRYLDRYERRDDVWKIAYRSEVVDWTRSEPVSEPYFEMAPDCLRGGRQDDAVFRRDNRYRGSKGAK